MDLENFRINNVDFTSDKGDTSEAIMTEDKFFELFDYAKGLEKDCARAVEMRMDELKENTRLTLALSKERKALAYCMKNLSGHLTAGQWKYLEKLK